MITRFGSFYSGTVPVIQPLPITPEGGGGPSEEPTEGLGCFECVGGLRIDGFYEGDEIAGLGKKLKKGVKKVGKVYKKAGRAAEKLGKKALPIAAAVAPFVPGVGVVAAGVLGAANRMVQQRRNAKRMNPNSYEIPADESYVQVPEETFASNPPMLYAQGETYGPPPPPSANVEVKSKTFAFSPKLALLAGAGVLLFVMRSKK